MLLDFSRDEMALVFEIDDNRRVMLCELSFGKSVEAPLCAISSAAQRCDPCDLRKDKYGKLYYGRLRHHQ